MRNWIRLLRPKQYLKNTFVFAALIFSDSFRDPRLVGLTFLAFAVMCMISSATYIINDAIDVERDKLHPTKCKRPLAAGQISIKAAIVLALVLAGLGLGIATWLNPSSLLIVVAYLLLQVLYNWRIKHEPVADVFALSFGFILRAVLGAAAITVPISGWLLFCTGSVALMLGFAKRRHEFILQGSVARESLKGYNRQVLDAFLLTSASGAGTFYAIYSLQSRTAEKYHLLPITVPFVIYGIARYVYLSFAKDEGGEPADLILSDPHILFAIAGFVLASLWLFTNPTFHLLER
jgi:4-hydroxybenzoate polyprenyltransferase